MKFNIQDTIISPNKLPFLQAQILQILYMDVFQNKRSSLLEISEITDYGVESKILKDAISALNTKGFIDGDFEKGFSIPNKRKELFNSVVIKNDYLHKTYSANILKFKYINKKANISTTSQPSLFETSKENKSNNEISGYNRTGVCHRWYDYLEDFPFYLIEEKIKEYKLNGNSLIVEPFSGSGTTNVSSKMFGIKSFGFDANPLMTFISTVKTTWDIDIPTLKEEIKKVATTFITSIHNSETKLDSDFVKLMPKKEINQWLSIGLQKEVLTLKKIIKQIENEKVRNVLLLAMSRSALDASYVSFCPGTTFYPFREKEEFWNIFTNRIIDIIADLEKMQKLDMHFPAATLINDSCLNANNYIENNSIDFLITSPPYPNDLEYTRQTRLEMYMLDFVKSMDDVQQVKRKMVKGSTKLIYKESNSEQFIHKFQSIKEVSDKIYEQTKDKNWGFDYPRMVREYFGDMYLCMKNFLPLMKKNAHFLQVVGDQTVKGVYIPVCDILVEMAKELGYSDSYKELFRIRRSSGHNVELPEEIVILKK
jgi:DNA modification methylase